MLSLFLVGWTWFSFFFLGGDVYWQFFVYFLFSLDKHIYLKLISKLDELSKYKNTLISPPTYMFKFLLFKVHFNFSFQEPNKLLLFILLIFSLFMLTQKIVKLINLNSSSKYHAKFRNLKKSDKNKRK